MNTPVSFELAKELKEKWFDKICEKYYPDDGSLLNTNKGSIRHIAYRIQAPTIAEVIMWLYDKHGIWIWVERCSTLFRPYAEEIGNERFGKWEGHKYNSLTEAYLKAIEYTLKTLV